MVMFRAIPILLAATGFVAAPVTAGGMLGTLPKGIYQCSLPGDALGKAWRDVPEAGFRIENASTYLTPEGSGVYLMKGKDLVFSRGPKKGERMRRVGNLKLRVLDKAGEPSKMLCVRTAPLPD